MSGFLRRLARLFESGSGSARAGSAAEPQQAGSVTRPKSVASASSRRAWLVKSVFLGVVLTGCLAPTLPLPPPDKPDIEGPDARGMVMLSGWVPAQALASALNLRTGQIAGQLTDETGAYRFEIPAEIDDELLFWYDEQTERSPSVRFKIR